MAMAGKTHVIIPRQELEAFWAAHGVMQTVQTTTGNIAVRLYKRQPTFIDPNQVVPKK